MQCCLREKAKKLMNNFEQGMHKNDANFVPLTPISFLDRIKDVYPDYEAIVYKERKYSWRQVYDRCTRFASALTKLELVKVMLFLLWQQTHLNYLKRIILFL